MKTISVLGAGGSIGRQTLDVCSWQKDELRVAALAAGHNWRFLADAARQYRPELVAIADETAYKPLSEALKDTSSAFLPGRRASVKPPPSLLLI